MLRVLNENRQTSLNEMYYAHQGEGPMLGTPSIFVRTHGCPVQCNWCDTPYTWDGSETGDRETADRVVQRSKKMAKDAGCNHIVLTGGEPMIQKGLYRMLRRWTTAGFTVEVETAAIFPPVDEFNMKNVFWNLSPKMASAQPKIKPNVATIKEWLCVNPNASLKVVIADDNDFDEFINLWDQLPGHIDPRRVFLMPCGTKRSDIQKNLRWLMAKCKGTKFKITTRMHVTAYGDRRGF